MPRRDSTVSRIRDAACAHWRSCQPETIAGLEAPSATLTSLPVSVAKRLLDHRVHPPTVYFPLLVDEALMIEPTETETKETLDDFAAVVREILEEAKEDPDTLRNAPYTTPVRRLDEARAAKHPVVRQP